MSRHVQRLSLLLITLALSNVPALAKPIPLDNDVDVQWSVLFPRDCTVDPVCPPVVVDGAPRLIPDASDAGDDVFIDLLVDINVSNLTLGFNVLDELGNPIPQQLGPFAVPLPFDDPGEVHLTLGDFPNFDLLPEDVPLIFTLFATVKGTNSLNGDPAAIITLSGDGTPITEVETGEVPEPATLLLVGTGIAAVVRSRARARSKKRPPIA